MDSINQQQPEKNYEDLLGKDALEKLREINDKATACFFCTNLRTGMPFATRPMAVQQLDDQGCFWFLSATDSHKNAEIAADPSVQLLFQGSDYADFLTVYGQATISTDRQKIKELWKPLLKTWFTEGEDDPRISVIRVAPVQAYYWDVKHNQAVAFLKRVAGAIVGKTLDDSIEGQVKV
ncbi:pyridoxamine 5'-phosphate oxidase family protein [Paraflavisolibacter sp. H34]|uniref:pyridoxamine 5'-phosphate oxidase family protein n=1 Tax=Huijunlia imazamoxiresistens TaxID=3127457 RepID=UPI003019BE07